MTLKPVAEELQALLQAADMQVVAGQTLLQTSQRLAEVMGTFRTDEAEGDAAEAEIGKFIAAQQRAFQDFERSARATEQAARLLQRRFGLQRWDWDQVRERIVPATRLAGKTSDEFGEVATLVSNLDDKQEALISLLQEIARLHTSAEAAIQRNLRRLSDRFRVIRQGTVATRAYDSGMAGYSAASALFIDRTR